MLRDECKPVILRALAVQDIDQTIACYLDQQAQQTALGFIDALQQAYEQIGRYPHSGSPRYAHEQDLPELR